VLSRSSPPRLLSRHIQEYNRGVFDYLIATDESMDTASGSGRKRRRSDSGSGSDSEGSGSEEEEDREGEGEQEEGKKGKKGKGKAENEHENEKGACVGIHPIYMYTYDYIDRWYQTK
jgi:hypothetical protein